MFSVPLLDQPTPRKLLLVHCEPEPVTVAVLANRHGVVQVLVVPVVVAVGVFVLQRFVLVRMAMGLRQVQHHAGQHQHAAQRHQPAG